jgi:RNA polymerase sigma factor (sigma-70 family)
MVQVNNAATDELVARLKAKDPEAFATLYDDYAAALLGVAMQVVQDKATAEDLLQDVFVKIWRHIDTYNPEKGRFFTWLLNIVRNTCKDYLRSKQYRYQLQIPDKEHTYSDTITSPDQKVYQDESWDYHYIIKNIKPEYREIIHLIYICGYTQEEAAIMLNIPLGTIKTRSRIAIKQLRNCFKTPTEAKKDVLQRPEWRVLQVKWD